MTISIQMQILAGVLVALGAYFIGNINSAILISRIKGKDIRQCGSGNPGTMNMLRSYGKILGVLTLVLDVLKGVVRLAVHGRRRVSAARCGQNGHVRRRVLRGARAHIPRNHEVQGRQGRGDDYWRVLDDATAVYARRIRDRGRVPLYNASGVAHIIHNDERAARRRGLACRAKSARRILCGHTIRNVCVEPVRAQEKPRQAVFGE